MELEGMEAKIFKALAHPVRLRVIKKLKQAKVMCVCELNNDVEFSQSNLSQHLRVLKDAGIVESEKEGLRINYRIKNDKVLDILECANSMVKQGIKEYSKSLE